MDTYNKRNVLNPLQKVDYKLDNLTDICNRIRIQQMNIKKKIKELRDLNTIERSLIKTNSIRSLRPTTMDQHSSDSNKNGVLDVIQKLEMLLFGEITKEGGNLLKRLERLEEAYLGEVSKGPFLTRLCDLKEDVYGQTRRDSWNTVLGQLMQTSATMA